MKTLIIALVFASLVAGQGTTNHYIGTTGNVSLSAAATALTIQQPTTNAANPATIDWASFYCSVACTVTEQVNCTAASATAGTWVALPGNTSAAASMLIFTASNAASCTTLKVNNVLAGQTFTVVFPYLRFGTTGQYTFTVSSITGTANITVSIGEQK